MPIDQHDNLADAREFCEGAFKPFGVDIEPYVKIIAELLDSRTCAKAEAEVGVREALETIRKYCDENLGPSRSSLLSKIAHVADAALANLPAKTERAAVVEDK